MSDEERGKKMSFFGGEEGKFCIFPVIRTANGGETIIRTAHPAPHLPFFHQKGRKRSNYQSQQVFLPGKVKTTWASTDRRRQNEPAFNLRDDDDGPEV